MSQRPGLRISRSLLKVRRQPLVRSPGPVACEAKEEGIDLAEVQRRGALKLLRVISQAVSTGKLLTYSEAARLIGRPQGHSRAIAQMCDLLDAAACLAGVPLLALVAVRAQSGDINPKAWKNESTARRDAIINRSLQYRFGSADYEKIANAIEDLGQRGNKTAWQFVWGLYPGDLVYRRLTGDYSSGNFNAINDLGTDSPDRAKSEVWSYDRDPKVRDAVMRRANGKCEYCGQLGFLKPDNERYLESHHVIALANDGEDRLTNVIALCPNDHREAHFSKRAKEIEGEMVIKLKNINSMIGPFKT